MKTTNILLTFAAIGLLASCEDEICLLDPNSEPQRLTVNAICTTGETDNHVLVSRTAPIQPEMVSASHLTLWVNGEMTEEYPTYVNGTPLTTQFHPNDEVRLEIADGKQKASAQVTVPQAIEIVGIDTLHFNYAELDNSGIKPYVRFLIHLRQPAGQQGEQYYRLTLHHEITTYHVIYLKDNIIQQIDSPKVCFSQYQYDYDAALSESSVKINDDNGFIEWLETMPNKYGLFRSSFFKDGEYTLCVDVPSEIWWEGIGHHIVYRFRVHTLPKIEYLYLNAVNALTWYDADMFTSNPVILPSNIEGGAGIFSISSVTEACVEERNITHHVGDHYEHLGFF